MYYVFTWFTEVQTIKRRARATSGCMATGQSSCPGLGCGL